MKRRFDANITDRNMQIDQETSQCTFSEPLFHMRAAVRNRLKDDWDRCRDEPGMGIGGTEFKTGGGEKK